MEQRLANTWRMTVNEKKFIESALLSGLRVDGRNLYDYRKASINFGKEDGSAEAHLGQTRVMGIGVETKRDDELLDDSCKGVGEEECLVRRTLAAHIDYIYTQKHHP